MAVKMVSISVTEGSRNFAECINRARYQGTTFALHKNGTPVARIVPVDPKAKPRTGRELAKALREILGAVSFGRAEATAWLHDLEQSRRILASPVGKWQS